jgi:Fur family transcriptional regulator, iron response regulator
MHSKTKLRNAGLRPTNQRIIIADILLNGSKKHFTAENLLDEINLSGNKMSVATIYNCLKNFKSVGLINQVESLTDTAIFDTNTDAHHHFLDEETGELTDISSNEINLLKLPDVPYGFIKKGVDVIIKIKKNI